MTPNQSRRHHPPKGNRCGNNDELLALVLQKIVSSTHNHSLTDLAWVEKIDLVESNLGRLEIKIHMVGVDDLDLNTRIGGSLSEIWI